jgi:hypothetical protein
MIGHSYTADEIAWLREHRPGLTAAELAPAFNARFGTAIGANALISACQRRGILALNSVCFKKGCKPWNTGLKGFRPSPRTEFKKGHAPTNILPVGAEVIDLKDGYTYVKIAEPAVWRQKHHLAWEAANGPLPKGCIILFLDGDNGNFALANLHCMSRLALLRLNKNRYRAAPAEIKPTVLALATLEAAIIERRL